MWLPIIMCRFGETAVCLFMPERSDLIQGIGAPFVTGFAVCQGQQAFAAENLQEHRPAAAFGENPGDIGFCKGNGRAGDEGARFLVLQRAKIGDITKDIKEGEPWPL
ncbi:MAG: hypothetical protein IPG51_17570 [Chloroflexi bacterium]|nr:hypothetical protein [Chloroflexota bacterium]